MSGPAATSDNPFKGLAPYGRGDRLFGRDADMTLMKDRVFRARTTLLFAGSGVGKTSFFRAKFIPEVERRYRDQFTVEYHSEWAGLDPLQSLKRAVGAAPDRTLLSHFMTRAGSERVWILVLDQFEELFQYHTYWAHFGHFRDELSQLINAPEAPVRIALAMREEFLGQLSAFDNRIPDLFANYYRLKNPDRQQAEEIIRLTTAAAGHEVDDAGLAALIDDLARVESLGGRGRKTLVARDYVIPPHMQLVCQGLWARQGRQQAGSPAPFRFLVGYDQEPRTGSRNPARRILRDFCLSRVKALDAEQQAIAARSFDYLVTSQGAKMSYELKSLAKHMGVEERLIGETLGKLSTEARILRESRWQEERWFELYHDMYAPIMYAWKEGFERRQRRERVREEHASICDRRAIQAEARENRDEALMFWLKAIQARDTETRRRQAARLAVTATGLERTFRHDGPVLAADFGRDKRHVVVASALPQVAAAAPAGEGGPAVEPPPVARSLVQVWSVESGAAVGRPVVVDGPIATVALGPDASLAAAWDRERLHIIDVHGARVADAIPIPVSRPHGVTIRFVAAGDAITLHHATPGTLLTVSTQARKVRKLPGRYLRLVFDDAGRRAAGLNGPRIDIIDAATMAPTGVHIRLDGPGLGVALSRDGRRLLAGTRRGVAEVWATDSGQPVSQRLSHPGPVRRVAFGADGTHVWTLCAKRPNTFEGAHQLRRWHPSEGQVGEPLTIPFTLAENPRFTDGGRFLQSPLRGVAAWNLEAGTAVEALWAREPRARALWASDDAYVLASSALGTARLWRPSAAPEAVSTIRHASGVQSVRLTADGKRIVMHARDQTVSLWSAQGRHLRRIADSGVTAVALGPENQVATLSKGKAQVWNAKGKPIASKAVRDGEEVWFDPGGRALLVSDAEGKLRAWVFKTGKLHARIGPGDEVALSQGGPLFATYARGEDGTIAIWKAAGAEKVSDCRHEGGVQVVLLSAAADRLLSAGYDGRVIVWDTRDGRSLHVWSHQGAVEAAAFSPNGRYAATVAADEFVRVWDVASGQELGRFRYGGAARTLFFSPDESRLMLASKWWVHCYALAGGLTPLASRRLGGAWLGEYRFHPRGTSLTALVQTTFSGYRCDVVDFGQVTDAPIAGAVAKLQEDWSARTGLGYEGEEVVPLALAKGVRASAPRKRTSRTPFLEEAVEAF